MTLTIYHNPDCGTSRNTLALLHAAGYEPRVVEYLLTPPSPGEIMDLAKRASLSVRQLLRRRGTPYDAMGLDDPAIGDAKLAEIAHATPILINRPIVDDGTKAALCRPSDLVFDVVPAPTSRLLKEEGVPVLRDHALGAHELGDLANALAASELLTDDLGDAGRRFFRYETLDGETAGFGGFEPYGSAALLRSLVVLPPHRSTGIGRNMALILSRRAFDAGARDLYLLTTTARGFFERLGFAPADRSSAPTLIRSTAQFAKLCPADAAFLHRRNDP